MIYNLFKSRKSKLIALLIWVVFISAISVMRGYSIKGWAIYTALMTVGTAACLLIIMGMSALLGKLFGGRKK